MKNSNKYSPSRKVETVVALNMECMVFSIQLHILFIENQTIERLNSNTQVHTCFCKKKQEQKKKFLYINTEKKTNEPSRQ